MAIKTNEWILDKAHNFFCGGGGRIGNQMYYGVFLRILRNIPENLLKSRLISYQYFLEVSEHPVECGFFPSQKQKKKNHQIKIRALVASFFYVKEYSQRNWISTM